MVDHIGSKSLDLGTPFLRNSCVRWTSTRSSYAVFPGALSLQVSHRAGVPENSDPTDLGLVLTGCWASCPVSDPVGLG